MLYVTWYAPTLQISWQPTEMDILLFTLVSIRAKSSSSKTNQSSSCQAQRTSSGNQFPSTWQMNQLRPLVAHPFLPFGKKSPFFSQYSGFKSSLKLTINCRQRRTQLCIYVEYVASLTAALFEAPMQIKRKAINYGDISSCFCHQIQPTGIHWNNAFNSRWKGATDNSLASLRVFLFRAPWWGVLFLILSQRSAAAKKSALNK